MDEDGSFSLKDANDPPNSPEVSELFVIGLDDPFDTDGEQALSFIAPDEARGEGAEESFWGPAADGPSIEDGR